MPGARAHPHLHPHAMVTTAAPVLHQVPSKHTTKVQTLPDPSPSQATVEPRTIKSYQLASTLGAALCLTFPAGRLIGSAIPALYSLKSTVSSLGMPRMPGKRATKAGAMGNVYGLGVVDEGDKAAEGHLKSWAHCSGFTGLYSPFTSFDKLLFSIPEISGLTRVSHFQGFGFLQRAFVKAIC